MPQAAGGEMLQPMMAGQLQGSGAAQRSGASRWRYCSAAGLALVAGGCLLNAGLLVSIRSRLAPTDASGGGPNPPLASGGGTAGAGLGSISGMVHCVVKGDDLCWLSFTCTDAASAHDKVQVESTYWANGTRRMSRNETLRMPGCNARIITAREGGRSCFATATMTEHQQSECTARDRGPDTKGPCTNFAPLDGFSDPPQEYNCAFLPPNASPVVNSASSQCKFPRDYLKLNVTTGCNPGWSRVGHPVGGPDGTFDPQAATISGSFHWKVTYAAAHGCVPVGGTYWEPGDAQAKAPGAPNQAFFCPAAMQAGLGPEVVSQGSTLVANFSISREDQSMIEPNGGATWKDYAAAPRSWGECHIPQTETLAPDSCRAKL
jgi:hypothetical protein